MVMCHTEAHAVPCGCPVCAHADDAGTILEEKELRLWSCVEGYRWRVMLNTSKVASLNRLFLTGGKQTCTAVHANDGSPMCHSTVPFNSAGTVEAYSALPVQPEKQAVSSHGKLASRSHIHARQAQVC